MRAVQYDLVDPSFPARAVELAEPELPNAAWARIKVTVGGICGSDLHMFAGGTGPAPALRELASPPLPFVLGHEIAGVVVEAGADCPVPVGTRVAVDPDITCESRGIEPMCPPCTDGRVSSCQRMASHVLTPGTALGFTQGLGGGWAEYVCAHRSMLHPVPDAVPDRAMSLHEPLSIAIHGLLRSPPRDGDPVLVVGAGIIGLAATAGVRALFPSSEVTVVARYDQQASAAEACGAHHVVRQAPDLSHFEQLAALSGAKVSGRDGGTMLVGGFPYVVEAVGHGASVTEALRAVDNWGTVLLLGAAGTSEVDLSPIWWKEAALVGAVNHTPDPGPPGGAVRHSVDRALDVLAAGGLPHDVVVTHEFALEDVRDAIGTALDRRASGSIKVAFRP